MRDIRLATIGRIIAGEDVGRYVEVIDDWADSGGFLILTFDAADRSGNGHDSWVETIVDVDLYFEECGWDVEWLA